MRGVPFLDLARAADVETVGSAMAEVARSGRLVLGEAVAGFEAEFSAYLGGGHCVGTASGTDAITLALNALGIGTGDEVIVPANTCVPSLVGVQRAGAQPVLVDVDPGTRAIDVDAAARVRSERTAAILAVHLYGLCADMDALTRFAEAHGLAIVEDAAQAHGAAVCGRKAGRLGAAAAFSFYPTKNLGAVGDAGAVVTGDPQVAARVRSLRTYGADGSRASTRHGWSSRLDEVQAAVLRARLRGLDAGNAVRRKHAALYASRLAGVPLVLPAEPDGRTHAYHLFVVQTGDRDALRAALAAKGVQTRVHYPRPLHHHPAYEALDPGDGSLQVSETLAREVLSLPLHPTHRRDELELVAGAVLEALA